MTRVLPDESVELRPSYAKKLLPFDLRGGWKVTARYELQLTRTKRVPCVRVRGPYGSSGNAIVLHLSEKEFLRLFVSRDERRQPPPKVRQKKGGR